MESDAGALCATIVLLILIRIHYIMAAYESALQSVPDIELQESSSIDDGSRKQLSDRKDDLETLTRGVWLMQALACTAAGFTFLCLYRKIPLPVTVVVCILLFYLFGSSLPAMAGKKNPIRTLLRRQRMVEGILQILTPVLSFLTLLSDFCIRLTGVDPQTLESEVTESEIISMVNEGHEQGVLDEREAEMIQNIFELDDKNAGNIMTHRKNVIGISADMNLLEAIAFMVEEPVSRFPVYEDNIDNILGVLHFKDAMKFHTSACYDNWLIRDIPKLLRGIRFIPETRGINDLFRTMQAEKLQMVMVVDEYGQTAGLVTMEDILEEIVGNIQDEYDNEIPLIRKEAENIYLMDGMAPLTEAEDALGVSFEDEEYDTLNGFLISKLDRIPSDGERPEITEGGFLFQILQVENKIIRLVKITKIIEEEKE